MDSFSWEVEVLRHECVMTVMADSVTEAREQGERFVSIFSKINLWGEVKIDTSYLESILNGSPIPEKYQDMNVRLEAEDIKHILANARDIEEKANEEKHAQRESKRIFRKVNKGSAAKDVSVNGALFLFVPFIVAVRSVVDLFKTVIGAMLYAKSALKKPKADQKRIKSKVDEIEAKGLSKRYYAIIIAIISLNVFLYINIDIILYAPVFIISAFYILIVLYLYCFEVEIEDDE